MVFEVGDVVQIVKAENPGAYKLSDRINPYYLCLGIVYKVNDETVSVLFFLGCAEDRITKSNCLLATFPEDELQKIGVAEEIPVLANNAAFPEKPWSDYEE